MERDTHPRLRCIALVRASPGWSGGAAGSSQISRMPMLRVPKACLDPLQIPSSTQATTTPLYCRRRNPTSPKNWYIAHGARTVSHIHHPAVETWSTAELPRTERSMCAPPTGWIKASIHIGFPTHRYRVESGRPCLSVRVFASLPVYPFSLSPQWMGQMAAFTLVKEH